MISNQITGVENLTKSISVILTTLLSKDIQLQYSACGREIGGQKKKSFCNTRTFECMRGTLYVQLYLFAFVCMCMCVRARARACVCEK